MLFKRIKKNTYCAPKSALFDNDLFLKISYTDYYKNPLTVVLGQDTTTGEPVFLNIDDAPHVLIGGATKSGKSVCIETIILELVNKLTPNELKLYICDPKKVDFPIYKNLPHLKQYADDESNIKQLLADVDSLMCNRYKYLQLEGVNKNSKLKKPFPALLVVFDELASIKLDNATKEHLNNIARLGRASGIHLLVATQRPDRNVIDGQLKANCPTRIAFRLQSKTDSRVLLDRNGAECLKGYGDGLIFDSFGQFIHFFGLMISDDNKQKLIDYWQAQPLTAQEGDDLARRNN